MQIIGGKINPVKIICSYVLTFLSQTLEQGAFPIDITVLKVLSQSLPGKRFDSGTAVCRERAGMIPFQP